LLNLNGSPTKYVVTEETITPAKSDPNYASTAARSARGLRALSLRVRDLVYSKQQTTYKEVSDELIADFYANDGLAEPSEDKNIKRRVYDALNVLLSSGVIQKEGKIVTWAGFPGVAPRKPM
jgi:hypothetical protein